MNAGDQTANDEALNEAARRAADSGENVRETVRRLTLEALSKRKVNAEEIRRVVKTVMDGVTEGVAASDRDSKTVIKQAFKGVDEALESTAEAVSLTMQEARGQAEQYAKADLQAALKDLESLEEMFLETMSGVARGANETARAILEDLVRHARSSGSNAGRRAKDAASAVSKELEALGRDAATVGGNVTRQIAQVASGVLAGIAERLEKAAK
jgi:hypothetical protein